MLKKGCLYELRVSFRPVKDMVWTKLYTFIKKAFERLGIKIVVNSRPFLVPGREVTIENAKETFVGLWKKYVHRKGSDELLQYMLERTDFFTAPASTRFHLCVEGGLCLHSIHVAQRLREIVQHYEYPDSEIPDDVMESIVITGLLHDLCKADMYVADIKNRKTYDPEKVAAAPKFQVKHDDFGDFVWESYKAYTINELFPLGHGEKSVMLAERYMTLRIDETFAIRYHMSSWQSDEINAVGKVFALSRFAYYTHKADEDASYLDEGEPLSEVELERFKKGCGWFEPDPYMLDHFFHPADEKPFEDDDQSEDDAPTEETAPIDEGEFIFD